jgi:hypothetical protein
MLPAIQEGDRVLVAHGFTDVRQGDVVVFRRGGRLVAHRVLRIDRRQPEPVFITKGDNIRRLDPPVNGSEIVGRVLMVERGGRQMALDTAARRAAGWLTARPEIDLLLCCARTRIDPANAERIRSLLREDVDWTYLLRTARRHGVMPLLWRSLQATCPEAVPQATLAQLRGHFHANARRNALLTKRLLTLVDLLEAHDIPVIPLKGPVLAASIYGNLALRQFGDLDILVHEQDVPRARDLLRSLGYQPRSQQSSTQETAALQVRFHSQFADPDRKVLVELHWRLIDWQFPFPFDLDRLWERFESVSLAGTVVRSFPPEDLLLFLCVHGSKPGHRWGQLGQICDVAELVRAHQGLDWGQVVAQAGRFGSERRLLLGLLLARDLLGTALPEKVRLRIQSDPWVPSLTAQVCEWLFREDEGRDGGLKRYLFDLNALERRQDRVRFCLRSATTSTAVKWALRSPIGLLRLPYSYLDRTQSRNGWIWPLPLFALLSFLYHLLLPIRSVARHGLSRLRNRVYSSEPSRRCGDSS